MTRPQVEATVRLRVHLAATMDGDAVAAALHDLPGELTNVLEATASGPIARAHVLAVEAPAPQATTNHHHQAANLYLVARRPASRRTEIMAVLAQALADADARGYARALTNAVHITRPANQDACDPEYLAAWHDLQAAAHTATGEGTP